MYLAKAGFHVVLAARNQQRGNAAVDAIKQQVPDASIEFAQVDMSSVASIVYFANWFLQGKARPLHVLIQNAGVFLQPPFINADGLEVVRRVFLYFSTASPYTYLNAHLSPHS